MTFIPEHIRHEFTDELHQADNDARTTGFFLVLIAPRSDGQCRDACIAYGNLPPAAILDRVIRLGTRVLYKKQTEMGAPNVHQ